jgi:hypothetical protein
MTTEMLDSAADTQPPADAVPATVTPPAASPGAAAPARRAPETARLYAADWSAFATWCAGAGLLALPATPATVAAFLAATGENSAGALGRRAAAIADRHRAARFLSPAADPTVRIILSAARRAATRRRRPPPSPAQLRRMAAACPGDFSGIRDRALLLLTAAGLGHATLVGLDVEQLRFSAMAVELSLHPIEADEDSPRQMTIPCGASLATCPVRALEDWLRSSGTRFGPVFRKIDRWGSIEQRRLGTDAIRRILARRTPRRRRHSRATA